MNEKRYSDDLDDFTYSLMEGIVGEKNMTMERPLRDHPESLTNNRHKEQEKRIDAMKHATGPELEKLRKEYLEFEYKQDDFMGLSPYHLRKMNYPADLIDEVRSIEKSNDGYDAMLQAENTHKLCKMVINGATIDQIKEHRNDLSNEYENNSFFQNRTFNEEKQNHQDKQMPDIVRNRFLVSWKNDKKAKDFTFAPAAEHFMRQMRKRGGTVTFWHNISKDNKALWARLEWKDSIIEMKDSICGISAQNTPEILKRRL